MFTSAAVEEKKLYFVFKRFRDVPETHRVHIVSTRTPHKGERRNTGGSGRTGGGGGKGRRLGGMVWFYAPEDGRSSRWKPVGRI